MLDSVTAAVGRCPVSRGSSSCVFVPDKSNKGDMAVSPSMLVAETGTMIVAVGVWLDDEGTVRPPADFLGLVFVKRVVG